MSESTQQAHPWLAWFDGLATSQDLRNRVTLRVEALEGLGSDSPVAACERLRNAWKKTYIPSTEHLVVIRQLVERVRICAEARLPSVSTYEASIYSRKPILLPEQEVWGLTGLAGCGKTAAMTALHRVFQQGVQSGLSQSVQAPIQPVIHITMQAQRSANPVLRTLANPMLTTGRKAIHTPELVEHLRQWLYIQGTQLLLVDELQSLTRGENSTTLIANLLTELNNLGLAVVYIFNYSLGHKLMQRPQEDKDRLLAKGISMTPPRVEDPTWEPVVAEYVRLASGWINIDANRDAAELHRLTAGLYRLLGFLLLGACRIAWTSTVSRPATMVDVRAAYQSGAYASQRNDVEALRSLYFSEQITGKRRNDLRCPFPDHTPPPSANADATPREQVVIPPAAAVHLMETSLNVPERRVLAELRAQSTLPSTAKASATVTQLPVRKAVSAQALLAGAKLLKREKDPPQKPPADTDEN